VLFRPARLSSMYSTVSNSNERWSNPDVQWQYAAYVLVQRSANLALGANSQPVAAA
jgi:hypothetical protein